jgi:phosphoribosylanthranilate isomerase
MGVVKLCGLARRQDVLAASSAGADLLGVIIDVPQSARTVSLDELKHLIQGFNDRLIAVLVEPSLETAIQVVESVRPAGIQLSGDESVDLVKAIIHKWPDLLVLKVIHVSPEWSAADVNSALAKVEALASVGATAAMVDTRVGSARGGTGAVSDWNLIAELCGRSPLGLILAGGLTPKNVRAAIVTVSPLGVDVASGTERQPRVKDPQALRDFVDEARQGFAELGAAG